MFCSTFLTQPYQNEERSGTSWYQNPDQEFKPCFKYALHALMLNSYLVLTLEPHVLHISRGPSVLILQNQNQDIKLCLTYTMLTYIFYFLDLDHDILHIARYMFILIYWSLKQPVIMINLKQNPTFHCLQKISTCAFTFILISQLRHGCV